MKFRVKEKRLQKTVSFRNLLNNILNESNLQDSFIEERIKKRWRNIVGDIMASHSIPGRVIYGVLYIFTDHNVYSNELSLMKDVIINAINTQFGFELVKNVDIKIKKLNWNK